jgi:hypothetical protein
MTSLDYAHSAIRLKEVAMLGRKKSSAAPVQAASARVLQDWPDSADGAVEASRLKRGADRRPHR